MGKKVNNESLSELAGRSVDVYEISKELSSRAEVATSILGAVTTLHTALVSAERQFPGEFGAPEVIEELGVLAIEARDLAERYVPHADALAKALEQK